MIKKNQSAVNKQIHFIKCKQSCERDGLYFNKQMSLDITDHMHEDQADFDWL